MNELSERSLIGVVEAIRTMEGGGFPVRRPFPNPQVDFVDPFLLIDEMGPVDWPPGGAIGAPDHPHRGFETVTYLLKGCMQHKDSRGNVATLQPGDVQWMTAGAGVIHSEMPEPEFQRTGGVTHGFQIWVNLPAGKKMMAPRYQDLPEAGIPKATSGDGKVRARVIAGQSMGVEAVIDTVTPIMYIHFMIEPGGELLQPVPMDHNALVYVFSGEALLGPEGVRVPEGSLATFGAGGDVRLAAAADAPPLTPSIEANAGRPGDGEDFFPAAEMLLLTGVPLNEPVERYGPFVMNTREEIVQAFEDYQNGRFGRIEG